MSTWQPLVMFTIHDASGAPIASARHFEDALWTQREIDAGEEVRRVADGAVCATKRRLQGDHVFSQLWRLTREPEWS